MIVRPHLEYASTCWNPYTKCNIDKLEVVQRRTARFVLNFYDFHPTDDLIGKILKSLQWDSLQHRRAAADQRMFHELRNNLANIVIPPLLVPSVKHNCHYNHIHSHAFKYHFLQLVSDFGISFLSNWQLNHLSSHFALQLSSGSHPCSGTSTLAQIPSAWFIILLIFFLFFFCCCYLLFVLLQIIFFNLYYYYSFSSFCCTCLMFVCTTTGTSP